MIFHAFYTMANMGGVYAILMFLLGMCLRPIFNMILMRDVVNSTHATNLKAIGIYWFSCRNIEYIKAIEDQKVLKRNRILQSIRSVNGMAKQVDQSFNEEEPLIEGGADQLDNGNAFVQYF